ENLRQSNGVSGFEDPSESPYDCYSAGHSSTSISAAAGFAAKRARDHENYDIVAMIGDSSIMSGLSLEALNVHDSGFGKIIIILNDNGMSISKPVGGFSKMMRRISTGRGYNRFKEGFRRKAARSKFYKGLYNFSYSIKRFMKSLLIDPTIFDQMGFTYIGPIDGHNIRQMERAFKRAKNASKSVVIHVETIKGKGYSYAEHDTSGYWHGVTPFDLETGKPKNLHPGLISWSHLFSDLTIEVMKDKPEAELVVPATLKGSGLEKVFMSYPNRTVDVGIAEEHALTLSGAMAINGIHPIVSIYSTFLQRAYDELSHDCARLNANMTVLVDRAGLVGLDGATHQGIYDVAFIKSIPNTVVAMPSNPQIARALYYQSFDNHGIFFIRFPREFLEERQQIDYIEMPFGRWKYVTRSKNKSLAILCVGPEVWRLKERLDKENIDVTLIDPIYLSQPSEKDILMISEYENILIYDQYGIEEGFADTVLSQLMKSGYSGKTHVHALKNMFYSHACIQEQLEMAGIAEDNVYENIKRILKIT
ncbi:MAG: 1-deoxy-D-xylulose-5-phosphate synthase, partial [Bacilli bacterium]|nr:1-deoxy-D-xylulose-5-phosphate synthase [Bacilli bacterium]